MSPLSNLLIVTASNGENLKLAQRFALAGTKLGAKAEKSLPKELVDKSENDFLELME